MEMVLITYANTECSVEPAHPHGLSRAFAVRSHNKGAIGSLRQRARDVAPLNGGSLRARDLAPLDGWMEDH